MEPWKRALVYGSFGAAAVLLLTGRRSAALGLAGVGAATLAEEYPEKFQEVWEKAPEYLEKGNRMVEGVSQFVEKVAEQGARWQEHRLNRGPGYLT